MPEFSGTLIPPRLSAAPSSPVTGQIYYHTGAKELRYWDGTAWITPSTLEIGNAYTEAMAGNMTIAEISSSNVNEDHVWMENFRITGMAAPVDDWDAATKAYVDANAGGGGGATEVVVQPGTPSAGPLIWVDTDEPAVPTWPPPLVTALPAAGASRVDGMEVYYRISGTSYTWHLRYEAAYHTADGYGWVVIAAPPLSGENNGTSTTSSTTYANLADAANSPTVYIPVMGYYDISFGCYMRTSGAGSSALMSVQGTGITVADTLAAQVDTALASNGVSATARFPVRLVGVGPLNCYYRATANTVTAGRRWISVDPVRLKS